MTHQETIGAAGAAQSLPRVRKIEPRDLVDALAKGIDDFRAMPTHAIFLCLIYPLAGVVIAGVSLGYNILPLFYPMAAGFALLGPLAAVGIYELSRRRELGLDSGWNHAFDLLQAEFVPLNRCPRARAARAVRNLDRRGAGNLRRAFRLSRA